MKAEVCAFILTLAVYVLTIPALAADHWVCSQCGHSNTVGKFCSECGTERDIDGWVCSSCGSSASGKFCSNCGSPRPSDGVLAPATASAPAVANETVSSVQAMPKSNTIMMDGKTSSISDFVPVSSVWGASITAYYTDSKYTLTRSTIGNSEGLKLSRVSIESLPMDVFYVFSAKMGGFMGLSKIALIVSANDLLATEDISTCKKMLIEAMTRELGEPGSQNNASTKWDLESCTVEIGAGTFKNYTGTTNKTVAVIIKAKSVMQSSEVVDSVSTSVYHSQAGMRFYMFDPSSRSDSVNTFVSGLYNISGLNYTNGNRGENVSEIQKMLVSIGYLTARDVDGSFGQKTAKAISDFQAQSGIPNTGIADLATQFMLVMKSSTFSKMESCYIAQSGNYVVVIWPLKAFYIGTINSSYNFVEGTYYFVNGEYYSGTYKNNLRSGQGTAHHPNGDVYTGQWKNDKMEGKGTYYYGGENSGIYYEGTMVGNKMTGKGTYYSNGKVITGEWSKNKHKSW